VAKSTKKKNKKKQNINSSASLIQDVVSEIDNDCVGTFIGNDAIDIVEGWIPSKNYAINYAMGDPRFGAIAQGRITEVYGPRSSAKSLILYDFGVECQKMDGIFTLIDSEASYTKTFGDYLGVDHNRFIYAQLRTVEDIFDFAIKSVKGLRKKHAGPILLGIDSAAASTTIKSLDDAYQTHEMGERARLWGKYMRDTTGLFSQENITVVIINQIRKKLGVLFGNPETTPCGEAIPYHSSQRLEVRKSKKITKTTNGIKRIIGHKVNVHVEKNRVRPPFARTSINLYVDKISQRYGLDEYSGLIDLLLADNIICKDGGKTSSKYKLVDDTSVKFTEKTIYKHWHDAILPNIPTDLYSNPTGNIEEPGDEDEEE